MLCTCFGIKTQDVVQFFDRPDASVDKLIAETKLGTKCTACLLNLDVELENLKVDKNHQIKAKSEIVSTRLNLAAPKCMVDSGFFINRKDIDTNLRVSNFENKFFKHSKDRIVPFIWRLKIYSDSGQLINKLHGNLAINSSLNINIGAEAKNCENGWFWLELQPLMRGLFGSTRPQFSITHDGWVSTVHTQPHMSSCKLKSVIVKSNGKNLNASVHIINADQTKKNDVTLSLHKTPSTGVSSRLSAQIQLSKNGSKLVELDELSEFNKLKEGYYILSVHSSRMCRKHIIINQKHGEMSIDHFPDRR